MRKNIGKKMRKFAHSNQEKQPQMWCRSSLIKNTKIYSSFVTLTHTHTHPLIRSPFLSLLYQRQKSYNIKIDKKKVNEYITHRWSPSWNLLHIIVRWKVLGFSWIYEKYFFHMKKIAEMWAWLFWIHCKQILCVDTFNR